MAAPYPPTMTRNTGQITRVSFAVVVRLRFGPAVLNGEAVQFPGDPQRALRVVLVDPIQQTGEMTGTRRDLP